MEGEIPRIIQRKEVMIMGQAQQHFDLAAQSYTEAIQLIRAMDEAFQQVSYAQEPEKRYDTRYTLYRFDLILQGILVQQALSDGVFDDLEQQFVSKITEYGDLMDYLRRYSGGQIDLTWAQLGALDRETQMLLVEHIPTILSTLCDHFVAPMAAIDATLIDLDVLSQLGDKILDIAAQLSQMDGQVDEQEGNAYARAFVQLLTDRWRAVTGQQQ